MNYSPIYLRLFITAGLLFGEALLLSLMVDASLLRLGSLSAVILAQSGNILRWIIVSITLFALFIAQQKSNELDKLATTSSIIKSTLWLVLNFIFFFALVLTTYQIFIVQPKTGIVAYALLWLALVSLTTVFGLLITTQIVNWKNFVVTHRIPIVLSMTASVLVVLLSFYFQQYWDSMTEFTFEATRAILKLFYDDVHFNVADKKLGLSSFWVYIAPSCSGIEGAILALSITGTYLFLARDFLKLPQAYILLPIAVIISVILNIIRIALLIIIGEEYSPTLAVGGFHSIAGWISAVLVALFIVFIFASWKWIHKESTSKSVSQPQQKDAQIAIAILSPFLIFSLLTLLEGIASGVFHKFYAIKVILALAVLYFFKREYKFNKPNYIVESLAIGLLVAILWIVLVPLNEAQNNEIGQALSAMPTLLLIAWWVFRLIGFLVVAPIIEELMFRGYLISRIAGQEINLNKQPQFHLAALIISSVIFGVLHTAWFIGILAGLMFALVRYRTQSISNAVLAHAMANLCVVIWALYNNSWYLL